MSNQYVRGGGRGGVSTGVAVRNYTAQSDRNAGGAAGNAALRARRQRQALAYKLVYQHVQDDRIQEMLDEINDVDRMGALAWQLVERECGHKLRPTQGSRPCVWTRLST